MNYYAKRRKRSGLTRSEIAEKLGIDYQKYELIERGKVKMPMGLLDRFNEITMKKEVNKIEDINKKEEVEKWWEENITARREDGKSKIWDLMDNFNIKSYKQLGTLMGYESCSTISDCTRVGGANPGFNTKNRWYTFFQNELNIQPIETEKDKEKKKRKKKEKTMKVKVNMITEPKQLKMENSEYDILLEKWTNKIDEIDKHIELYENVLVSMRTERDIYVTIVNEMKGIKQ